MLTIPGVLSAVVEPALGFLGDAGVRGRIVVAGGISLVLSLVLFGVAPSFAVLLVTQIVSYPASGAFVSLSQATLVDLGNGATDRRMAQWMIAGSVGALAGPMLLAAFTQADLGWRPLIIAVAVGAMPLVWASGRIPHDGTERRPSWGDTWRRALAALRQGGVRRWLLLLELADLLGDMLAGYVALYLVDVAGASPARAAVGVALWTGSELVGSAALVPLLNRVPGLRYLRATALMALCLYPAFLLTPGLGPKLTLLGALGLFRAGWYPVLTARLYEELPGASGTAMGLSSLAGLVGQTAPLAIGAAAGAFGLGPAMWLLLAAPVALLLGVPRGAAHTS